jgi:cell fate (sporulation/competence/biofilm development) regulator YmcA (YheA/YmcA/DUF963 family)
MSFAFLAHIPLMQKFDTTLQDDANVIQYITDEKPDHYAQALTLAA